jgi:hypothetical protein
MTVKDLKTYIENLPDDMEIILQKDSEGNGYSPLYRADSEARYVPDSTWSGDVYFDEWGAEDNCMTKEQFEEMRKLPQSLILSPVN